MSPAPIPDRIRIIISEWSLLGCIFPSGRHHTATKTFIHARGDFIAITRYVDGALCGHIVLTAPEFAMLGDFA